MKISDLIHDQRNANKHTKSGMKKLKDGLKINGLGRSILISSDNEIIAGNGITESAKAVGIKKVRIVETDGTEIIAVKRTDIKSGSKEFFRMALSDNIIAKENISMDAEVVDAICEEYDIDEWKEGPGDYLQEQEEEDSEEETAESNAGSKEKDNSITREYKESKYPLSIVLTRDDMRKWDAIKKDFKVSEDNTAFLRLLNKYESE